MYIYVYVYMYPVPTFGSSFKFGCKPVSNSFLSRRIICVGNARDAFSS